VSGFGVMEAISRAETSKLLSKTRSAQKEADAALVEAAGCVCGQLGSNYRDRWPNGTAVFEDYEDAEGIESRRVVKHDNCCPVALAAKIRGAA
jgi:hypothetical protein